MEGRIDGGNGEKKKIEGQPEEGKIVKEVRIIREGIDASLGITLENNKEYVDREIKRE